MNERLTALKSNIKIILNNNITFRYIKYNGGTNISIIKIVGVGGILLLLKVIYEFYKGVSNHSWSIFSFIGIESPAGIYLEAIVAFIAIFLSVRHYMKS